MLILADCCDGSDEHSNGGVILCPNTCATLGAESRRKFEVLLDEINAGLQKRSGLLTAAETADAERQGKIATLRAQATELEATVDRLRRTNFRIFYLVHSLS